MKEDSGAACPRRRIGGLIRNGQHAGDSTPPGEVSIEDIAHHLPSGGYFAGRAAIFHSMVQHDLLGSTLVPAEDASQHSCFMPEGP